MSRQSAPPADNTALRRQAKKTIDQLSGLPLRLATEFLSFVKERQSNEATGELLRIPDFAESFARGVKDARAGRVKPWRKVRAGA
jgi:hypothetical protein